MRAWLVKSYPLLPLWGDGKVQLFNGEGVSLAQQGGAFILDFARDAHVQA